MSHQKQPQATPEQLAAIERLYAYHDEGRGSGRVRAEVPKSIQDAIQYVADRLS